MNVTSDHWNEGTTWRHYWKYRSCWDDNDLQVVSANLILLWGSDASGILRLCWGKEKGHHNLHCTTCAPAKAPSVFTFPDLHGPSTLSLSLSCLMHSKVQTTGEYTLLMFLDLPSHVYACAFLNLYPGSVLRWKIMRRPLQWCVARGGWGAGGGTKQDLLNIRSGSS